MTGRAGPEASHGHLQPHRARRHRSGAIEAVLPGGLRFLASGTRSPRPMYRRPSSPASTPPLGVTASYLTLDGFVLELMHYAADGATAPYRPRTMNEPGLTHLSISVDDVQAAAERGRAVRRPAHRGERHRCRPVRPRSRRSAHRAPARRPTGIACRPSPDWDSDRAVRVEAIAEARPQARADEYAGRWSRPTARRGQTAHR